MSHADASVVAALSVHLEPLVSDARVLVLGDPSGDLSARLDALGAASAVAYDARGAGAPSPGAYDLAVIADLSALEDLAGALERLRRVLGPAGTVVAMGRARMDSGLAASDAFPELAPAALGYAELYDVFASRFDHVAMTGVVPFRGVVFAELGGDDAEPGVSVDTRLAEAPAPEVFVVVAGREPSLLERYAIVQLAEEPAPADVARDVEAESAFAAMHLKSELLGAQLDEQRSRVTAAEVAATDASARVERMAADRDALRVRVAELEATLAATREAKGPLEHRLETAEREVVERSERIAVLEGELEARRANVEESTRLVELVARVERSEAALALNIADLAQISGAHAEETAALEAQLRDRARVIADLEKELVRREQLVHELVASLEEARAGIALSFAAAPVSEAIGSPAELQRMRQKLDELALEVARREGELRAQAWRITELENVGRR